MVDAVGVRDDTAPIHGVVTNAPERILRDPVAAVVVKAVVPELDVLVAGRRRRAGSDNEDPGVAGVVDVAAHDLDLLAVVDPDPGVRTWCGDLEAADAEAARAADPDGMVERPGR